MKITFIHHSSFCVELQNTVFIFDYFRGEQVQEVSFGGLLPEFDKGKRIYVCSSHKHKDHFDLEVLRWAEKYPSIQYIFSKDIRLGDNYLIRNTIDPAVKKKIHFMKAGERLSLDGAEIETLMSTDEGVAFLVTCEGKTIYHAGDLHWWHWEGEDKTFLAYQEKTYKQQIDLLKGKKLDVAFVVLDPRLEQAAFYGMDYFMDQVEAAHVIPMHLWQKYQLVTSYRERPEAESFQERILDIKEENQIFEL